MGLDLKSGDIIFLDTAPFIYFFERHPDYFQLGTAVACGADYIITNDRDWRRVEEIQVIMVGDL